MPSPFCCGHWQATYVAWTTELLGNITRLRASEAASRNGSMAPGAAVQDIPFSQLFSDWAAANKAAWLRQQVPIANALMTINVQVRHKGMTLYTVPCRGALIWPPPL